MIPIYKTFLIDKKIKNITIYKVLEKGVIGCHTLIKTDDMVGGSEDCNVRKRHRKKISSSG